MLYHINNGEYIQVANPAVLLIGSIAADGDIQMGRWCKAITDPPL
jgi:hypothetical protein